MEAVPVRGGARPAPRAEYAVLPAVARAAIAARLDGRAARGLPAPSGALAVPAPVFVTLHLRGALRGCIGTLEPQHADLVAEVADRARAAAFEDPRFPPLTAAELEGCTIDVSILGPLEEVHSADDLEPRRFGIEVTDPSGRHGVLLPDIPGVDSVSDQLAIACRKAGIAPGSPLAVRRFEVVRIGEERGST